MLYRSFIILVWIITILIIFKIVNNFLFKNGSSLIFITLIFILPLIFWILTQIARKKSIKEKKKLETKYYLRILNDIKESNFDKQFINPLKQLISYSTFNDSNNIIFENENLIIGFNEIKSYISIKNTNVTFSYYYSNKFYKSTIYDEKFMQYQDTKELYQLMINKLETLLSEPLIYETNKYNLRLIGSNTKQVYYEIIKKPKKIKYKRQILIEL